MLQEGDLQLSVMILGNLALRFNSKEASEAGMLGNDERVALICGERCQLAPEQHQRGHYRWSQKKAEKLEALDASEDAKQNP